MIIIGGSRGGGAELGKYLMDKDVQKDERATVLEIRGTVSADVVGALKEMEAYASGTKCEKPIYHFMLCPAPGYPLTREQAMEAIDLTLKELGLSGQPRVVVAHEKDGQDHYHGAVARIDVRTMTAIPDSHNYRKHEEVARELERRFGHPHVQGAHAEREGVERPDRSPTRSELRQEERTGIKGKDVTAEVTALRKASDGAEAFVAALDDAGYVVAKGDRRDFVLIDRGGGEHSLARRAGMKAGELREFMAPVDRNKLPGVDQAKDIIQGRLSGGSAFDQICWEDSIAAAAIDAELRNERGAKLDREEYADQIAWEDALYDSAIAKAKQEDAAARALAKEQRRQRLEDHRGNRIERSYASSGGYSSQSNAAMRNIKTQERALRKTGRPFHPKDHRPPTMNSDFRDAAGPTIRNEPREIVEPGESRESGLGEIVDRVDHNKSADKWYRRLYLLLYGVRGHDGSDQKREAAKLAQEARTKRDADPRRAVLNDKPIGELNSNKTLADLGEDRYERMREVLRDHDQDRRKAVEKSALRKENRGNETWALNNVEITEAKQQRVSRIQNAPRANSATDRDDWAPDRQREAPGGGRTRSR